MCANSNINNNNIIIDSNSCKNKWCIYWYYIYLFWSEKEIRKKSRPAIWFFDQNLWNNNAIKSLTNFYNINISLRFEMVAIKSVIAFPRYLDILDISKVTFFYSCYRSSYPIISVHIYVYSDFIYDQTNVINKSYLQLLH